MLAVERFWGEAHTEKVQKHIEQEVMNSFHHLSTQGWKGGSDLPRSKKK